MLSLAEFKNKLKNDGSVEWTTDKTLEFFWCFSMRGSRDGVWSFLSDTSRFNREIGMSERTEIEKDGKIFVTTTLLGLRQEWIEEPWTWVKGETICSTRNYLRGVAKSVHAVFHIDDSEDETMRHVYIYFGWKPSGWISKKFLSICETGLKAKFQATFFKIDVMLMAAEARDRLAQFTRALPALPEPQKSRLVEYSKQLVARDLNKTAVEKLCEYVESGDEMDLESIRLIPLAKQWDLPLKDLLVVCLNATRLGMLKISWNVICPHCRASRFATESIGDLPDKFDCSVCEVDFKTDDENSIEIFFHVHPSIRTINQVQYCASEPAKKTHIKVQQRIGPHAKRGIKACLQEGNYRVRFIGDDKQLNLQINSSSNVDQIDLEQVKSGSTVIARAPLTLSVDNQNSEPKYFFIEDIWWQNKALHPSHLLSLPEFRDLFSEEHLSSNVKLFMGEMAILFTDIVGSTKFYKAVGDAKAFSEVQNHFQEVYACIRPNNGVVVKTIGDAVMASFPTSQEALNAGIAIQERFYQDRKDTSIRLRISIHKGPVIAVQLNTGIDYFGSTVNYAAKIQSCANGSEIALSKAVFETYLNGCNQKIPFPIDEKIYSRDSADPSEVYVLTIGKADEQTGEKIGPMASVIRSA